MKSEFFAVVAAFLIAAFPIDSRAAQASFSTSAPALGPNDIANLAGAALIANNVSSGDPNATYLADDRPVQGQTFTTGNHPAGYQLTAVTLRHVTYQTYALVPDLTYTIRITTPVPSPPNRLAVIASETAVVPAAAPGNIQTILDGNNQGPGSGRFVTFTLANPVALNPNTTYGFDVAGGTTRHYWECDGNSANPYAGGTAYTTGTGGVGSTTRNSQTGDRVFIVALTQPSAPAVSQPTISPTNQVFAGAPVMFSVGAAGTPPLHLQWRVDEGFGAMNIAGANSTNLVVDTTGLFGNYIYDVVVTNVFGAVTSPPVTLTVISASLPVVTLDTTPSSATRYVGQEVTFMAEFDGTQPISYQWQRFGFPSPNIPNATNTALTLTNLLFDDEGEYTLFASNFVGTASSSPATLTVLPKPPPPPPGSFPHALITNGPLAYWRLNDPSGTTVLYNSVGNQNAMNENVTLGVAGLQSPSYPGFSTTNTAASFSGNSAATTGASLMSGLTNFTVLGWFNPSGANGPFAGLFGQNDVLEVGYSDDAGVNLWVQLTGIWMNPKTGNDGFAIGQWYFVAIVADGTSVSIYINGVERAHQTGGFPSASSSSGFNIGGGGIFGSSGDYFTGLVEDVAIFNTAFSAEQVRDLYTVAVGVLPPSILTRPRSQSLYAGRTARFTASGIGGASPLTFQWQHASTNISDSGTISGATSSSLTINNVTAANAGDYQLIISNAAGSITSSVVTLTIVAPTGNQYESGVMALNPLAYWRLNELADPSQGGVLAHDYAGGFAGTYGNAAQNGFNGIAGPRPSDGLTAFETSNTALQSGNGVADSWVTLPALNLNTNAVSFTMWIKPNGPQADYAAIFMTRSGTEAGLGYGGSFSANAGQLIYTWNNNSTWTFVSGLTIPPNQWSFIAAVIEPAKATLYLYNATAQLSATNTIAHGTETWGGDARIGGDPSGADRTFGGIIDEVAVFHRALTPAQILNLYNGAPPVTLGLQRSGSNLILNWTEGVLQESTSITGSWLPVGGAAPPSHTVTPSGPYKYFRVLVSPPP
ncbi:MAG: immunoglobulin domain-containing protein [Verrucomicrobia subdivision 3 bacterium]|nr:immunoglobulin domain-containing protein [Limisphaerales bacterium]